LFYNIDTAKRTDISVVMKLLTLGCLLLFSFCVDFCVATLFSYIFVLVEDILSALEAASGRKHPSTVQVKQLKTYLPLMPVLRHFVTSPVNCALLLLFSLNI